MKRRLLVVFLLCSTTIIFNAYFSYSQLRKKNEIFEAVKYRQLLSINRKAVVEQLGVSTRPEVGGIDKILVSDEQIVYRYVSALAISPNFAQDNIILAGVTTEGIYRSTDRGKSWKLILTNDEINCIVYSPNYEHDKTIFVGADFSTSSIFDADGDTWRIFGSTTSIDFSPNYLQDSTVYSSFRMGYAISHDGGKTWKGFPKPPTHTEGHSDNYMYDINLSPFFDSDSTVFLSTELGYFKSTNGARSWNQLWGSNSLFAPSPVDRINFFPTKKSAYLALAGTNLGLYQIAHEDTVWQVSNPERVILPESVSEIIFSPNYENDQTIFVSTAAGVFKSTDDGRTWSSQNNGLTDLNIEAFVMSPNFENDHVLVVGTHDGVFISDTPQIEWKPRNNSLPTSFGVRNLTKNPYQLDHNPRIVSSEDNAIHIFWKGIHFSPTKSELVNDTYYQRISEGTEQVFTIPTPLESFAWRNFEVDADRDGFVHLLLSVGDIVESKTYYVNNQSGEFSIHVFASEDALAGDLKADKDGYAHIIGRANSSRYLFYSNNETGQFKTVELTNLPRHRFTYGENENTLPRIQIDSNDNIHLFYPGESQNVWGDLYYSNNKNGDFSGLINVSNTNIPVDDFFVLVDKSDTPHFIYKDGFSNGQYRRLIGDSLSSSIGFGAGIISGTVIDEANKIHLSLARGSEYGYIENDNFTRVQVIKGFQDDYTTRGGGIAITEGNNIHIVRSNRSNNIKSDFDFDVYLISFKSNSNTGHITYGYLANSDDTIPLDKDVSFRAYLRSNPEDTVTQNTVGCGYKNGNWFVQCASFVNQWQPGNTLRVEFTNTATGKTASVEGTLTSAESDLFPKTVLGQITSVEEETLFPKQFDLAQNYPNPFNPETILKYQLPKTSEVRLEIYNILGQRVAVLVDEQQPAGYYSVKWHGTDESGNKVATGIYLYRLKTTEFVKVKKLTVLR